MLRVANRVVAKKPFLLHEQQSDGCVGCLGDTVELRACAETSPVPRRIPGSIVLLTDQGLDQIDGDLDAVALPLGVDRCRLKDGADAYPLAGAVGERRDISAAGGLADLKVADRGLFQIEVR